MPTYTYKCPNCGAKSTRLTKIAERDNQTKVCGDYHVELVRLIDKPGSVWAPTSTGGGHK